MWDDHNFIAIQARLTRWFRTRRERYILRYVIHWLAFPLNMMSYSCLSAGEVESAIDRFGVAPGGSSLIHSGAQAAQEAINSGLYITWAPTPFCTLTSSASDEIRNGTGQCCRISSKSVCMCGHSLASHKKVKLGRGYIKPPTCSTCRRCTGFNYVPSRPEECGQWWLPRRADFNLTEWRQRIRDKPHEYACIGCEQKVSDHETVFESLSTRQQRGATVGSDYIPLSDQPVLSAQVLGGEAKIGGRVRRALPPPGTATNSNSATLTTTSAVVRRVPLGGQRYTGAAGGSNSDSAGIRK